jgi:hypothetical protein
MEYFTIEIDGQQQFKKSYLLYVVEIEYKEKDRYFYVGQTGDRHHLTARPAFRRLAAHLSDQGSSTENQVYRGIAVKILKKDSAKEKGAFSTEIKQKVSGFLTNSKIKMHVFPIQDFPEVISGEVHKKHRDSVENIESNVIRMIIELFGDEKILNKKSKDKKVGDDKEIQKAEEIIEEIKQLVSGNSF